MNDYLYIHKQVYTEKCIKKLVLKELLELVILMTLDHSTWNVGKDSVLYHFYFSILFGFSKIEHDMFSLQNLFT